MQRIIITNSKGGCGKSTIATNLAAHLAPGRSVSLFDYDPQGSAMHWLKLRGEQFARIHGVAAHRRAANGTTDAYHLRLPRDTDYVICDTPAGMVGPTLAQAVQSADVVLVPVLPSPIDIDAVTHFVSELLLTGKARSFHVRIGVIANRVRANTVMYRTLTQFLKTLNIPFVAALRDSQHYIKAAELGVGTNELGAPLRKLDEQQWRMLAQWIDEAPRSDAPLAGGANRPFSYREIAPLAAPKAW